MDAFEEIYHASAEKVYGFLLRLSQDPVLAEELMQETFYQAYLHIHQFEGRCEIDTWLCQIARNAYYKELKRRSRHTVQEAAASLPGTDMFSKLEDRQQALQIHCLLHQLQEPYREVFSLHVFGELTFREIAAVFRKSESWAKMTFYRAKTMLVTRMEAQDHEG